MPVFTQEISFENVSFSYPNGRCALTNVSFKIRKGEKIALVGHNGAGKSTIVKLLLRFYDPAEGRITVDGVDLKTINIQNWRSLISGSFQDFGHYHFTVRESILLGNIHANEEHILQAAKAGELEKTLQNLPKGLSTPLGKEFGGTSLSGGEWQKIAMARSFVKNASLLILDEPTASLDPKSEIEVFNQFADASSGKTVLLITHRLGSIKMADRILVFKFGKLVEEGTQVYLLKANQKYAHLFFQQAKQYQLNQS
jgi:ATP-binding cassette subfamily B protein